MIKRLLLFIAVIIIGVGSFLPVNPYILLEITGIIILMVLAIALAPFSLGCAPGVPPYIFGSIVILIILLLVTLWATLFPEPIILTCNSTLTYPDGTVLSNISVVCP